MGVLLVTALLFGISSMARGLWKLLRLNAAPKDCELTYLWHLRSRQAPQPNVSILRVLWPLFDGAYKVHQEVVGLSSDKPYKYEQMRAIRPITEVH